MFLDLWRDWYIAFPGQRELATVQYFQRSSDPGDSEADDPQNRDMLTISWPQKVSTLLALPLSGITGTPKKSPASTLCR